MSWLISHESFIPLGILHYFHGGLSRDETLACLLKSHEGNPKMFPRIDYRELDFWYNSFQNKNFDLHQTPIYPTLSKLENLPVLGNILHRIGTKDQKSLRRASDKIKKLIDHENRLYDKVELRITSNSMKFEVICGITKNKTETIYKRLENGCEIAKNKMKTISELSMFDAVFKDFKQTVEKMHTKVKLLTIKSNEYRVEEADRVEFLTRATAVMASLKEPLHVEELVVGGVKSPQELNTLLGFIKPGVLSEFDLHIQEDEDVQEDNVFKASEVTNLKSRCENLKNFTILTTAVDLKLDDFAHIPRVFIEVDSVTNEELVNHKNKILTLKNFQTHFISVHESTQEMEEGWAVALAPFDPIEEEFDGDEDAVQGSWPIPGNDEDMLVFELNSRITFSKKSIKKMEF